MKRALKYLFISMLFPLVFLIGGYIRIGLFYRQAIMTCVDGREYKYNVDDCDMSPVFLDIKNKIKDKYNNTVYCYFYHDFLNESITCYIIDTEANIWVRRSIWKNVEEELKESGVRSGH